MEFLYFDIRNNPKGELRKVKFNNSVNMGDYLIDVIWEVELNVYIIVSKKSYGNKIKEDPLFKCFIVDASKNEQSASISQINLPFYNDPKSMEMEKEYPYCKTYFFDLGDVWVFSHHYKNEKWKTESVALHYVRKETH